MKIQKYIFNKNVILIISVMLFINSCFLIFSFINRGSLKTYNVTINANGSNANSKNIKCSTYDEKCIVKLPTIKRDNWDVVGFSDKDGNIIYSSGEKIELFSDIELFVVTKKDVVLSLIDVSEDNVDTLMCTLYNNDAFCQIKLPNMNKDDWNFLGWSNEENSNYISYENEDLIDLNDNVDLYAVYNKNFFIDFVGNGSIVEMNKMSCDIYNYQNSCQVILPNITRDNYEVLGWSEDKNDVNSIYKVGDAINIDYSKKLYAITRKKVTVSFLSNDYADVYDGIKSCYLYNVNSSCIVDIPTVVPKNGSFIGWTLSNNYNNTNYNNVISVDYKGNSIKTNKNLNLYPVVKKTIVVTFDKNGASYVDYDSKSCDVYNGVPCSIKIPSVDKPGMISFGFSSVQSSNLTYPEYISKNTYYFRDSINLYADFNSSWYRNVSVYNPKKYNNVTVEIEKSCSYEKIDRVVSNVMNNMPWLFQKDIKVSFYNDDSYDLIHKNPAVYGKTFGYFLGPIRFIDIRCFGNEPTLVHELTHYYDILYYLKYDSYFSDGAEVTSLYNKYYNMTNRPMWSYVYENKNEFLAGMVEFYYSKHYTNVNTKLPEDIEDFVVNKLKKIVE